MDTITLDDLWAGSKDVMLSNIRENVFLVRLDAMLVCMTLALNMQHGRPQNGQTGRNLEYAEDDSPAREDQASGTGLGRHGSCPNRS